MWNLSHTAASDGVFILDRQRLTMMIQTHRGICIGVGIFGRTTKTMMIRVRNRKIMNM